MIEQGDTELDAVLRDVFPLAGSKPLRGSNLVKLPGATIPGGGAAPRGGGGGGPAAPPEPVEQPVSVVQKSVDALRRMLEDAFLHAAPPPHQMPPGIGEVFDIYPAAAISIPGGGYGAGPWTDVISYTVPENFRATLTNVGQQAGSAAAYQDLAMRIQIDSKAHRFYSSVRLQLFQLAPPGKTIYIPVRGGQTLTLQMQSLSTTTYSVFGRLQGWQWPTRFDEGESATRSKVG